MADTNKLLALVCVSLLLIAGIPHAVAATDSLREECTGETWTAVDRANEGEIEIRYRATFNEGEKLVCLSAENTGEKAWPVAFSLSVDGLSIPINAGKELEPGESYSTNRNITDWLDVVADNHSVSVGTFGGEKNFNFTQKIDESNEGGVPSPHISEIEVIRNHTSGKTFLEVTVISTGEQGYSPTLLVQTFETDSNPPEMQFPDQDTITYRQELEESPDETIVGDLKLYDHWKKSEGKFDRIEFVSYPNGSLTTWETQFEEVPSLRDINGENYYQNDSARKYRGPDVKPISETAANVGAVLTVVLLIGVVWYRRWRKFR